MGDTTTKRLLSSFSQVTLRTFTRSLGDEIHFMILSRAKEIMPIVKVTNRIYDLRKLAHIEDSLRLCRLMVQTGRMIRVIPHLIMYPDP